LPGLVDYPDALDLPLEEGGSTSPNDSFQMRPSLQSKVGT
jgi:hypothetical protein